MSSTTIRFAAALLILTTAVLPVDAREPGSYTVIEPVYRVATRRAAPVRYDAARVVDPDAYRASTAPRYAYPQGYAYAAPAGDPYGFAQMLNAYRAMAGLPPVAYDASLSAWASRNNVAQSRRGLGHHINPNCFQNCGWNYSDAGGVARGWMDSPGHRANMLSPSITRFGIAYGPGPYWTMNAM